VCWELGNIIILPILDIMSESTTYSLHVNSASSVTVYLNPLFFLIVSLPLLLLWLPKRIACVSLIQGSRLLSRIQLYLFRKFCWKFKKVIIKKILFFFLKDCSFFDPLRFTTLRFCLLDTYICTLVETGWLLDIYRQWFFKKFAFDVLPDDDTLSFFYYLIFRESCIHTGWGLYISLQIFWSLILLSCEVSHFRFDILVQL
jgi:hypothetical protein